MLHCIWHSLNIDQLRGSIRFVTLLLNFYACFPFSIAYRLVPEVIPRDQLQGRDYRQLTAREGEVAPPPPPPPRSDHVHEMYYPERSAISHAPTHSAAAELAPQQALPPPSQQTYYTTVYEDPNRAYAAESLRRPVSSRVDLQNMPVSSLYSFAGPSPAYR